MAELSRDCLYRILRRWPIGRLAMTAVGGGPSVVPIVFVPAGGSIWSPIDGKPKRSPLLARLANVRYTPLISLLIDEYTEDWSRLWWVRLDAMAEVKTFPGHGANRRQQRVIDALRDKYPQYRTTPLFDGMPTLLRIDWQRVTAWAFRGLDWLERRFPPDGDETPGPASGD